MKALLKLTAAALLIVAGLSSCEKTYENPGSSLVNAAIKINVGAITAAEASVDIASEQENITSLVYVPATKYSQVDYLSMDAVKRLAYIQEHGQKVSAPYTVKESNLDPGVAYSVAAVGLDQEGTVRTAPTFVTFSSESAITAVSANYIGEIDGKYQYSYSMKPNDFVKNYKYIVSNDPSIVKKSEADLRAYLIAGGKDVLTETDPVSVDLKMDIKKDLIVATLSYDELGRPCTLCSEIASTKSVVFFILDGKKTEMQRINDDDDIFEGSFSVKAKSNFTININKDDYGFWSFSGNGGVGQNVNEKTSSPYYYLKPFIESKSHTDEFMFISESIGRMQKISEGGNELWVNEKADGKIFVRIDLQAGDNIPRYYVKWVKDDPSVILEQNFDLFSYGAYYMIQYKANSSTLYPQGASLKFSSAPGFDGTLPGEKAAGNGTNIALYRSNWPNPSTDGGELANEVYIKNRGMLDWELVNFSELSGALAMGNGNFKGRATTPYLTKLTGKTDINVEYDTVGYGNNTDDFAIHITGEGKFTSCEASVDGATSTIAVTSDKKVVIPSGTIKCFVPSGVDNKVYTHIKAKVSGADASTRIIIAFDESTAANSKSRSLLDNVKITK